MGKHTINIGAETARLEKEIRPKEVQKKRIINMGKNPEIKKVWDETGVLPKLIQEPDALNRTQRIKTLTGDEIELLMDYYEQNYMFEVVDGKKKRVARPMSHFVNFLYKNGYIKSYDNNLFSEWRKSNYEDIKNAANYCYAVFENNTLSGGSKGEIVARMADMALRRNDPLYKDQPITMNVIGEDPMAALSDEKLQEIIGSNQENYNIQIDHKDAIDVTSEDN